MPSIIRELAKNMEVKIEAKEAYISSDNFMLYGPTGKSAIVSSLGDLMEQPVLLLSPAGGSNHLKGEFKNIIPYSVSSLTELENIIVDLERNMDLIKKLQFNLMMNNQAGIKAINDQLVKESPAGGQDDFDYCLALAKQKSFPISAIALEEMDVVSSWIQDKVEETFEIDVLGEDRKNLSSDWAELRKSLVSFYTRILKLPVRTIFCTGDKLPKESQTIDRIQPNIAVGAAARLIVGMVGNIFYTYSDNDKFYVRFIASKTVFAKQKFVPVKNPTKIDEVIDITNDPSKMWKYISDIQTGKAKQVKIQEVAQQNQKNKEE